MVLVSSSHIDAVDWDEGVLTVVFHDGGKYEYSDVPEGIYREMLAAPSVGQFFRQNVKGAFAYQKIA